MMTENYLLFFASGRPLDRAIFTRYSSVSIDRKMWL